MYVCVYACLTTWPAQHRHVQLRLNIHTTYTYHELIYGVGTLYIRIIHTWSTCLLVRQIMVLRVCSPISMATGMLGAGSRQNSPRCIIGWIVGDRTPLTVRAWRVLVCELPCTFVVLKCMDIRVKDSNSNSKSGLYYYSTGMHKMTTSRHHRQMRHGTSPSQPSRPESSRDKGSIISTYPQCYVFQTPSIKIHHHHHHHPLPFWSSYV